MLLALVLQEALHLPKRAGDRRPDAPSRDRRCGGGGSLHLDDLRDRQGPLVPLAGPADGGAVPAPDLMEALHELAALRALEAPRVEQRALPRHAGLALGDHLPAAAAGALAREAALRDGGDGDLGLRGEEGARLLEVALRREGLAVGHEHEPDLRREEASEERAVLLGLALHKGVRVEVQRLDGPPLLRLGLHKELLVPREQRLDGAQERARDRRVRVAPARTALYIPTSICILYISTSTCTLYISTSSCTCNSDPLEDGAEGVAEGALDGGREGPGARGAHEDGAGVCLEHVDLLERHAHVADGDEGAVEAADEEGHGGRDVADEGLWEDGDEDVLPREREDEGAEGLHRLGQDLGVLRAHEDPLLAEERREQLDGSVHAQGAEQRRQGHVVRERLGLGPRQRVLAALQRLHDNAVPRLGEGQREHALEHREDRRVRQRALLLDDVEHLREKRHAGHEAHDADALGARLVEVPPAVPVLLGPVRAR